MNKLGNRTIDRKKNN